MQLTPEQKRGIQERFAVLIEHNRNNLDYLLLTPPTKQRDWYVKIRQDIEACRDEVIALIERPPEAQT